MDEREAHKFYSNPEHLRPAGPAAARRGRPGLRNVRYEPPSCGPQATTVNTGSQPYWQDLR